MKQKQQGTVDLVPVSVLENHTSQQLTGLSDIDGGVDVSRASNSGGFNQISLMTTM
jgi:hypothetical protein